ncbi:MAG TPA: 2-amino-4-hydroxy-6-hydroxymethyldihydropteridine diphosphokinase [Deltaproteobacteria bacterium]|nr:2-amino-4-hydroxy-6-hydroxymethyldihydropteridine diphosphokinase [Deltaproteobacteria bacterium]
MRRGGEIVYVAVGANLGDRDATFSKVIRAVERESNLLLLAASPIFETEPIGPEEQNPYLNAVLGLRSWFGPLDLLRWLQSVERALGRTRDPGAPRWGPRMLDLDLLFFGDRCLETPELVIPHVRAHERNFVMVPMAEIAPSFVHPRLGRTIVEIARSLVGAGGIQPWPRPVGWPGAPDASVREPDPARLRIEIYS